MSLDVSIYEQAFDYMRKGDYPNAVMGFERLLIQDPTLALAWNNRGLCFLNVGHPFDAILNLDKAIEIAPQESAYYNNKGACYFNLENTKAALEQYQKALDLNPNFAEALSNSGNAKKWDGDLKAAISFYRKALEVNPDYVDAHLHLAFTLLNDGQYEEGWKEFEWRWKSPQLPGRGLKIPQWDGEPLDGKTLLIYAEQGFGDALQFVRYAPLVKQRFGGKIWVEVKYPLTRLVKIVEGIDRVVTFGEDFVKEADYAVPMMTLPRIMGTTVETIPWNGPYFKIDPQRSAMWSGHLDRLPQGPKIGICWAGMSRAGHPEAAAVDARRSMSLADFAPVALTPNIGWVNLQKGPPLEQIKTPPRGMTIGEFTEEMFDFYDTASMIERLDLVISVDTAVAHVAAALGKPTWLLSRWDGCWRWLGNRPNSPWYPSVRVFGQPAPGAWGAVADEVAVALRQFVKEQSLKAA